MKRSDIIDAYLWIRKNNHSITDDVLDFMKDSSIKELNRISIKNNEICMHPIENRKGWHDSAILCDKCNCIIEQYGKIINPPCPLI